MLFFDGISTPVGRIHIVVSDTALVRLWLPGQVWEERYVRRPTHPIIQETKKQLEEYFSGARRQFDLPLARDSTRFQQKVWKVLERIPYGITISYVEVARKAGSEHAVRAVGSANGKNPIPIIVPCHRVARSDGSLGGYAGGDTMKAQLLALETHFR